MKEKLSAAVELGKLGGIRKVPKGFSKMSKGRLKKVAKKGVAARVLRKSARRSGVKSLELLLLQDGRRPNETLPSEVNLQSADDLPGAFSAIVGRPTHWTESCLRRLGEVTRLCFPKLTQAVSMGSVTQGTGCSTTGGPETACDEIDRCNVLRL